jgi:hypothetical protein
MQFSDRQCLLNVQRADRSSRDDYRKTYFLQSKKIELSPLSEDRAQLFGRCGGETAASPQQA